MAGALDLAYGYRPAVPVNKRKWSNNFLEQKFADTDVESSMYRDAAMHEPEETADFRARRSARDRMLGGNGLNIGRTGSGERANPMMPGAAGMGTGPSNTNYGGQGAKANWYIDQENVRNEDPRTAQRGFDLASQVGGTSQIDRIRNAGGLAGVNRMDPTLMDRFVSSDSTLSKLDPQQRAAFAERRQAEETRKADRLTTKGDDGMSISDKLKARGEAKAAERTQRIEDRRNGPSDEQRILAAAMQGHPGAIRLAEVIGQGNRETNVAGIDAASRREGYASNEKVAGIQSGQPAKLSPEDQYRADTVVWGEGGGEAVLGPFDEWRSNGGLAVGGDASSAPPKWIFGEDGEPIDQERFDQLAAIYNLPPDVRDRLRAGLKPKAKPWWSSTTPSTPPMRPASSYVGRAY